MLKEGYRQGTVELVENEHSDGVVCKISDNWFYFGGLTAEELTVDKYVQDVPEEDIIASIFEVLEEFKDSEENKDAYDYYEAVLRGDLECDLVCGETYTVTIELKANSDLSSRYLDDAISKAICKNGCEVLDASEYTITATEEPHMLIYTDGYGIVTQRLASFDAAKAEMEKEYANNTPEENDESWSEMSYCNDTNAMLYANGDNVFVWEIIKL